MAAESDAKFVVDGDSFEFCGGTGVETLDEGNQSLIGHIVDSLSKGMDITKVLIPTFFLEPRSLLEKYSDLFAHPHLFTAISKGRTDVQRMLAVVKWFISGWHLRPNGCKKPYNPILGEKFFCFWDLNDAEGSKTEFIGEQVSHHPPISGIYVENRKHNLALNAHVHAKGKFLGNSVASVMDGEAQLYLTDRPAESYKLNFPTIYACGLFVGKLRMEIGGEPCIIRCDATNLEAKIEFVQEGLLFGDANRIEIKVRRIIKDKKETLYTMEGRWDKQIMIKDAKTEKVELFYDAVNTKLQKKVVAPISKQGPYESAKVWAGLSSNIRARNYDTGTQEKVLVEEAARVRAKEREEQKLEHAQDLFRLHPDTKWWTYMNMCLDEYDDDEVRTRPAELQTLIDAYDAAKKANKDSCASAWEPVLLPPPPEVK